MVTSMTNKNQIFSVEGDTDRCIGRVINFSKPTQAMIALFRGIDDGIADHFGCGLMGAGPCGPDCLAFKPRRIVPRALTDVQRRGGRGTP